MPSAAPTCAARADLRGPRRRGRAQVGQRRGDAQALRMPVETGRRHRIGERRVGQPDELRQRAGRRNLGGRRVMEQDRVGKRGVELPAIDQPGAGFRVADAESGGLACRQRRLAGRIAQRCRIGRAKRRQQQQFADVVQQAGQVGFFGTAVAGFGGQRAGQFGDRQRMPPKGGQFAGGSDRIAFEQAAQRQAGRNRADHPGAQRHQAGIQAVQFAAPAQGRRIGGGQHARRQAGIAGDQVGQLAHRRLFTVDQLHQTQQHLRRRRHAARFDGPRQCDRHVRHDHSLHAPASAGLAFPLAFPRFPSVLVVRTRPLAGP